MQRLKIIAGRTFSTILFFVSSCGLLFYWGFLMAFIFVPWDISYHTSRPPQGSIARTINDSLDVGATGSYALMGLIILYALSLTLRIIRKKEEHPFQLFLHWGLANVAYLIAGVALPFIIGWYLLHLYKGGMYVEEASFLLQFWAFVLFTSTLFYSSLRTK